MAKPRIIRRSRHHWHSQHHLPQANIIEKSHPLSRMAFSLAERVGFGLACGLGPGSALTAPGSHSLPTRSNPFKSKIKKNAKLHSFLSWRRERDSNPRARERKLISSSCKAGSLCPSLSLISANFPQLVTALLPFTRKMHGFLKAKGTSGHCFVFIKTYIPLILYQFF